MSTARTIVADLQVRIDSRDLESVVAAFDEGAVLVGSSRYNSGDEAVRAYLTLVLEQVGTLHWDLARYDVFLAADGLLGFAAEGHVEWTEGGVSQRDPFRLTIVAADEGDGWRVRHFHGSLPQA